VDAAGLRILVQNLSAAQRNQHKQFDYFDVVGGETGARYRIHYGDHMNIEQFDASDQRKYVLCLSKARLPVGQVMLAQKIALELFETETLRIANSLGVPPSLRWRPPPPSKR
jgi:hypothetical protein